MEIYNHIEDIKDLLNEKKQKKKSIGFVPTMGALHKGHLSLIREAKSENDMVVASVFVNPLQFNDSNDLANYPRDFERDAELLRRADCDVVFHPEADEVFPAPVKEKFDFGDLDKEMEGKFRPGHFQGVATVVKRLFEIVQPDRAYFGIKDYQQLVIIHKMTKDHNLPVEIIPCPIVREPSGLAMSSRNSLLSKTETREAELIYEILKFVKIKSGFSTINEIKEYVERQFHRSKVIELEYFEIVDMYTLKPLKTWAESNTVIALMAAWVGKVRLIDNIILFS